ncbi:NAD(P)-binding protein [Catenulispora yoronensis]
MNRRISRRDFLDGVALVIGSAAAGPLLGASPAAAAASSRPGNPGGSGYPPALTGMRGSYDSTFAIAHALRDGTFWDHAGEPRPVDGPYDLVVVGAGISGLSAAHYYLRDVNPKAKILILDPHDDFGGHAKRNEFTVAGRTLIGAGGSETIESPGTYPPEAFQVFDDLGFDLTKFPSTFADPTFYARNGAGGQATFFAKEVWGTDYLGAGGLGEIPAEAPLDSAGRNKLLEVFAGDRNYLPGLTPEQTLDVLRQISYGAFLTQYAQVTGDAYRYLLHATAVFTGVNVDQFPALDAAASFYPGTTALNLDFTQGPWPGLSKTIARFWAGGGDDIEYQFPDGNASIARALVRRLIPQAISGSTMEDLVTAHCDYSRLDHDASHPRIRLSSTVVRVQHWPDGRGVDVAYVRGGTLYTVRAGAVVMACWNAMIPYIAPDLSDAQKAAGHQAVKYPLIKANVAVTNWRPWQRLGVSKFIVPGGFWGSAYLDTPVNIGDYRFPTGPDDPIVITLWAALTAPGMDRQAGARQGRTTLTRLTFADLERSIRDLLARTLGPHGFDPAADIAAVTTNRWAHGYARWYSTPFDPFWPTGPTPADIIGTPVGRLTVATTDQANHGFVDGALESAYRAVQYLATLH